MKKRPLTKLALLGLTSGLLIANEASAHAAQGSSSNSSSQKSESDPNDGNLGYHLMTEDELTLELNDEGQKLYNGLDTKGKALARYVASQRCQGTNECSGLNACQDDTHACAGKGSCKGKSKCGFSDKNLAVKVVAEKMAKKRAQVAQGH